MSEEIATVENEVVSEVGADVSEQPQVADYLRSMILGETIEKPVLASKDEVHTETASKVEIDTPITESEKEEILAPNEYLKSKWGWENEEVAEAEIKALREKAAQKDFEWKNEDSKTIAELINEGKEDLLLDHLYTKKELKKLLNGDLSDKNTAAELVKFGMRIENKELSDDDINFLFQEKYSIPQRPIQGEFEEEGDYNAKLIQWENQKNAIERRLVIEAKMNQPKLAQFNKELVLPKIERENQNLNQPSQEDLAAFEKDRDTFLQNLPKTINSFNGFEVQIKDKDVNYTVSYTPSQEEKSLVNAKLQRFAESGFNTNEIFYERWVNKDGSINQDVMTKDLSRVLMGDKAEQKIATDAANKRLEAFLKEKKQINVKGYEQVGTFKPNGKTEAEVLTDAWLQI